MKALNCLPRKGIIARLNTINTYGFNLLALNPSKNYEPMENKEPR